MKDYPLGAKGESTEILRRKATSNKKYPHANTPNAKTWKEQREAVIHGMGGKIGVVGPNGPWRKTKMGDKIGETVEKEREKCKIRKTRKQKG